MPSRLAGANVAGDAASAGKIPRWSADLIVAQLVRVTQKSRDNGNRGGSARLVMAAGTARYFAAACELLGELPTPRQADLLTQPLRAMGVVAAITPWNRRSPANAEGWPGDRQRGNGDPNRRKPRRSALELAKIWAGRFTRRTAGVLPG